MATDAVTEYGGVGLMPAPASTRPEVSGKENTPKKSLFARVAELLGRGEDEVGKLQVQSRLENNVPNIQKASIAPLAEIKVGGSAGIAERFGVDPNANKNIGLTNPGQLPSIKVQREMTHGEKIRDISDKGGFSAQVVTTGSSEQVPEVSEQVATGLRLRQEEKAGER